MSHSFPTRRSSDLYGEVKSLPHAPEVLIKEVTLARIVKRTPHRNLEEFPGTNRRAGGQATGADGVSLGMTIKGTFHKYFEQIAKNLASGWPLVRVEVSSKSVRGPSIK